MSWGMWLLRGSLAATSFLTLLIGFYSVASAPSVTASYLGVRGLKRLRTKQRNVVFRELEPALRWLGQQLRPLLSKRFRQRIDRQITLAGDFCGLVPEEVVALTLLSLLGGAVAGGVFAVLLSRGALYVVVGGVVGVMLPYLQLSGLEQERRKQVQNGLPYVIDLLSLGLSAGLDLPAALRQVVEKSSNASVPLIEEINLILQELQVGKTRKQALEQFAERIPGESVREFVGAIVQAEERGNPLGQVLEIQAEASRQSRSSRAEEAASRASVKMLGPMVLLFTAILLLVVSPMILQLQDRFGGD